MKNGGALELRRFLHMKRGEEMFVKLDHEKLRRLRKENKISQEKLAKIAKISTDYLHDMEVGEADNPTISVLYPICRELGVTVEELAVKCFDDEE